MVVLNIKRPLRLEHPELFLCHAPFKVMLGCLRYSVGRTSVSCALPSDRGVVFLTSKSRMLRKCPWHAGSIGFDEHEIDDTGVS